MLANRSRGRRSTIPQKPKNHKKIEEYVQGVTAGVVRFMERHSRNSLRLSYMVSHDIDIRERFEGLHSMPKEELEQFWIDVHTRYEAIHPITPEEG